jgi:hypothetical protein
MPLLDSDSLISSRSHGPRAAPASRVLPVVVLQAAKPANSNLIFSAGQERQHVLTIAAVRETL